MCISLVENKIYHDPGRIFSAEVGCLSRAGLRNDAVPFQPDRINYLLLHRWDKSPFNWRLCSLNYISATFPQNTSARGIKDVIAS